ncbi:uncharacterized protein LOC111064790 [Drosophila obscura]|uniref:uncharacterized protein LOC111064790 n=1 Tax=Drosophila obscura TaxID=7282 RepID=UPI001BB2B15F|nr:uncharacterized protein LOC111064790 [Drosophila obscura]
MGPHNLSNIVNLPPKKLSLIFICLERTKDRQRLAQTHPVLRRAFALYAADRYQLIDFESLPTENWPFIFSACGSNVKGIMSSMAKNAVAAVKLAAKHCPNLEELFISIQSKYWDKLKPLLVKLKALKDLRLMNDYTPIDLMNTLLELPEVTTLQLFRFKREDLIPVKYLLQLQNLFIKNDEPLNLYGLCADMAQLESLEVRNVCISFPAELIRDPLWPKLKLLNIGIEAIRTEMPYLPRLRILHIEFSPEMELGKLFGRSVSGYSNSLQVLRLYSDEIGPSHANNAKAIGQLKSLKLLICSNLNNTYLQFIKLDQLQKVIVQSSNNVTNSGVLRLLRGCKNLRTLDVSGCRRVNQNVVGPLIKVLQHNDVQPDNPLVLTVQLKSFGEVPTTATDPNYNLFIKICENFTCERPFTVPDPPFDIEYYWD